MNKSIAAILVLICLISCKISEKYLDTRKANDLNPQSPLIFNDIKIELEQLNIEGLQLPRFALSSDIEPHHYEYEVCLETPKAPCRKGNYYWGAKIIPGLASGNYLFKAKACFREQDKESPLCSAEVSAKFTQKGHDDKALLDLVNKQKNLSDMIRKKAQDSHVLFTEHYESEKEEIANIHFFNMMVMNHLNLGPLVSGELLNSYAFLQHYERQIEKSQQNNTEKKEESVSTDQKIEESKKDGINENKQVDEDEKKQSSLKDQSNSEEIQSIIDRIEKLEKEPKGVYPSGTILLTLSTTAVLTGIITASLSTASLVFSPTIVNGMEQKIISGINSLADSLSKDGASKASKNIKESLDKLDKSYKSLQGDIDKYLEVFQDGLKKERMEPLLDLVGQKVRALAHQPLRYVSPMRPEEIAGEEFLQNPELGKQLTIIENQYFVLSGNQPIEVRFVQFPKSDHTRVFRYIIQKDDTLIARLDEKGKKKRNLSKETLKDDRNLNRNAVSLNNKRYVKIEGAWCLEDKVYQIQGDAVFLERKNGQTHPLPEQFDRFPKLHPETVKALNTRQAILARNIQENRAGTAKWVVEQNNIPKNPGSAWAKGIPLFDTDGRLIEPPEKWKVPGKNWFYRYSGVVHPVDDQGKFYTLKNGSVAVAESAEERIEYKVSDKDNLDKVNPRPPQARIQTWERLYMEELEASLWAIEGNLSNLELEASVEISSC